jgi:integrase
LAKLTRPGRYAIGHGAYLQISQSGTRAWVLRYRVGARAVHMGLGSCNYVTLADARQKAIEAQRLRLDGRDPLQEKRAAKRARVLAAAHSKTFRECALAYIAAHESGWKGHHSRRQWTRSLEKYVYPQIGDLSVADVDLACVLSVIEPIWTTVPETARRVRNRIELVLDWAAARGLRTGDNPARWKGLVENLLPQRKPYGVKHLAAMKYVEVPEFMQRLRAQKGYAARALEFAILTACRSSEASGARWSEIEGDTWIIPAARTKAHREHRIPLPRRAVELLAALPRADDGEYVFPATRVGGELPRGELLRALQRLGRDDVVVHGFRSAFSDWAHERTTYPNIVIEQALAHTVGSAVERSYRRTDLLAQRARLMQDWSNFCDRPHIEAEVVPIRRARDAE